MHNPDAFVGITLLNILQLMASQKKIETVKKVKEKLELGKSIVLADHTGLNHKTIESLRKNIKKAGGTFLVIKNNLLKKALENTEFDNKISEDVFAGQTSLLISTDDEISPLKELVRINRELNLPKIKAGAFKDRSLNTADIIRLADLPHYDILVSQVIGMLKSPQTRLVFALKGNLIKLALVIKAISEKNKTN